MERGVVAVGIMAVRDMDRKMRVDSDWAQYRIWRPGLEVWRVSRRWRRHSSRRSKGLKIGCNEFQGGGSLAAVRRNRVYRRCLR